MKKSLLTAAALLLFTSVSRMAAATGTEPLELLPAINASGDSKDWLGKRAGSELEIDETPRTYRISGGAAADGKTVADSTFTVREYDGKHGKVLRLTTDGSQGITVTLPDGITLDVPGHTTVDVDFGARWRWGIGGGALAAGAGPVHEGQPLTGSYEVSVLPAAEVRRVSDPKAVADSKQVADKVIVDNKDSKALAEPPGPVVAQQSGAPGVTIPPGSTVAIPASGVAGFMPPMSHYAFAQGLYGPYVIGGIPVDILTGKRPRRGGPGSASNP